MYIEEIPVGTELKLIVSSSNTTNILEFTTYVVRPHEGHSILVEAIRFKDKVLSFKKCNVVLQFQIEGRDYQFEIGSMSTARQEDEVYHVIKTDLNRSPVNRRGSYRVGISENAMIQIGVNRKTCECMTRDLSMTGISYVVRNEEIIRNGELISGTFTYTPLEKSYKVLAKVVRIEEVDDKHFAIGCKAVKTSSEIQQLIAYIMRKEALIAKRK